MDELLARVEWTGRDSDTGVEESGVLNARLEDFVISPVENTRGNKLMIERIAQMGPEKPPAIEDIERIRCEVESDPRASEVVETWYVKGLQLSPTYYLAVADHPQKEKLTGFGFSCGTGPIQRERSGCGLTFAWDWFNVVEPNKAQKLQETGSLRFEQRQTPCGLELVHILFETDVSMRISLRAATDVLNPRWRLDVRSGSEIFWPSLVEGKNVSNGFLPN